MSKILNPQRVEAVLTDCLFKDGEDKTSFVKGEGIKHTFGFHPERLESHRQDVIEMLGELPNKFKGSGEAGYSFLGACIDRHGDQWTDDHATMDRLLALGIALGEADYCLPRELWAFFPGGMPYFMVKQ